LISHVIRVRAEAGVEFTPKRRAIGLAQGRHSAAQLAIDRSEIARTRGSDHNFANLSPGLDGVLALECVEDHHCARAEEFWV
jgi:hypothetical protein